MRTSGIYIIQDTFQVFPYPFSDLINGQWDTNHLIWQIRELRLKELDAHLTILLQLQGSLRDTGFQPPGFKDEEIKAQGPQEPYCFKCRVPLSKPQSKNSLLAEGFQQEYNARHICNLKFSSTYIFWKGDINYNNILFNPIYLNYYFHM